MTEPLAITDNGLDLGQQLVGVRTVLPVYRGARVLLTERGWGRKQWGSRATLGLKVSSDRLTSRHVSFSVPGALLAAARDVYGKGEQGRKLAEDAFYTSLDGMLSTLLCSDVANPTIQLMSMEQRVAIAGAIMRQGEALQSVAMWNDVSCVDATEMFRVMDHTVWLHEQAEQQLRNRLQ